MTRNSIRKIFDRGQPMMVGWRERRRIHSQPRSRQQEPRQWALGKFAPWMEMPPFCAHYWVADFNCGSYHVARLATENSAIIGTLDRAWGPTHRGYIPRWSPTWAPPIRAFVKRDSAKWKPWPSGLSTERSDRRATGILRSRPISRPKFPPTDVKG